MSWIISLLIIAFPNFYTSNDSITYDVVVLPQSSVKGIFIGFQANNSNIVFYNYQSRDTDNIPTSEVKYLFYNTLKRNDYDTLYLSVKNFIAGKILFQNDDEIIFWNSGTKKIEKYDDQIFLNTRKNAFVKQMEKLFTTFISIGVFTFIFGLSLAFSKDFVSALLFFILTASAIFFSILIRKIIKK